MIEITNTDVHGWEAAIRGMRNPMNSWDKSDSYWGLWEDESPINPCDEPLFFVGENDLKLMKSLAKAGSDHGKFLRMINVTVDITAPLYWWKEFDTYKVGTVANSCSTMHKIHAKEFTLDDFSCEHLDRFSLGVLLNVIKALNIARDDYLKHNESRYEMLGVTRKYDWWQMIQLLPTSYNQKRTVQLNYEVLRAMDRPGRRKDHKLDEWREFCEWVETLPYMKEFLEVAE